MDKLSRFVEQERKEHYHYRIRQCLMNVICNIPNFIIYKFTRLFSWINLDTGKMIMKELIARIKYKEDLRIWK